MLKGITEGTRSFVLMAVSKSKVASADCPGMIVPYMRVH